MPQSDRAEADATFAFALKVGGTELEQARPGGLDYLAIEDHCDMIGVAEFTIEAGQGVSFGDIQLGLDVEIQARGEVVFKGYVVELRHALRQGRSTLTVLSMDPLCKAAATREVETYLAMTDSDIVTKVLTRCGVPRGVIDSTSLTHPYTMQRNESDLQFLRRLAARNGFMLMAEGGKVHFRAPQFSNSPIELDLEDLISFDYAISSQGIPRELTVIGWDPQQKAEIQGVATDGQVTRIGRGAVFGGEEGIWLKKSYLSDVIVTSQGEANAIAKAELDRMSRNYLRGRAVIEGNPEFRAGTRVRFTKFDGSFAPDAFVVSSRHRVTPGSGYVTEFAFCSNVRE